MHLYHPRESAMHEPATKALHEPAICATPLKIYLVEDSAADALLISRTLDKVNIPHTLKRMKQGDEMLHELLTMQASEMPDLIMLDLGLPGMDGFELIETLSKMPHFLRAVPIVVLTAYLGFDYIDKNYPLQIRKYINKPCKGEDIREVMLTIRH